MEPTFNVLGNSDPASAVIGRAIRLVLNNVLDLRPGKLDRATLGHPGKFGYCVAEDEEGSGWTPWPNCAAPLPASRRSPSWRPAHRGRS